MSSSHHVPHTIRPLWLTVLAVGLLAYALAGNYVALPGYLRFLERGGTSPAGNTFDLAVLIGATRTVLWMYSFQLGVVVLAIGYAVRQNLNVRLVVIGGLIWLALWSWPSLPAPGAWFYLVFGSVLLICIFAVFTGPAKIRTGKLRRTAALGAVVFFAFATWEVCGLGSTGRMLHPAEAALPIAHNILVTQSSKLMIELVLAWALLALSLTRRDLPDES